MTGPASRGSAAFRAREFRAPEAVPLNLEHAASRLDVVAGIQRDPGQFFKGSISQVQNICASGLGVLARADNTSMAQSCSSASTAMTALNVAAAVRVLLLIVGGANLLLKSIRQAQQGASGPDHDR